MVSSFLQTFDQNKKAPTAYMLVVVFYRNVFTMGWLPHY